MRLIFYIIANIIIILYVFSKEHQRIYQLKRASQDLREKINILTDDNTRESKNRTTLQEKITRYQSLKKIVEELNQNLTLESVADSLASIAFSLIAKEKGVCVLYLIDSLSGMNLSLFKTRKDNPRLIIKPKQGDIFDFWVLRHSSPLLIEDIKKDFRFDLEKLKLEGYERPISSLISAPFLSNNRLLGILRLDRPDTSFYGQGDLRFLVTLCDLGAVALENSQLFQKTQDLATHDELTSLFTKGYFLERLKEECKRTLRQDRQLSLLMLDIDYFKNYNDKFGHSAGDIVLRTLSQNLIEALKDSGAIVSRFGGEEFCVILPNIDKKSAITQAQQLRSKIEKIKIILREQESAVTVSIGVASFPDDTRDDDELIFKADRAMYEAKQKGRNRVCGI